MNDMKDIIIDCGFKVTEEKAHATEYAYGNTIIYTVPAKRLNVVVSPEDYLFVKDMEISKYHNTALTDFPKEKTMEKMRFIMDIK